MPATAIARLESLLRAKKLDRTTFQLFDRKPDDLAETGQPSLDELLAGGFVRGHLSEIVGARSSGRTGLLASVLAAATGSTRRLAPQPVSNCPVCSGSVAEAGEGSSRAICHRPSSRRSRP